MPRLLRLAKKFGGRFLLARLNTNGPDDLETRYRLAAVRLTADDYDAALAQPLEIARRDPAFRAGAGRDGLLAVLDLLGEADPRVSRYRAALNDIPSRPVE